MEMLTQSEAEALIRMLKESLVDAINFPGKGKKERFKVRGTTPRDLFDIQLFRGTIAANKVYYSAIVTLNKQSILELHVGDTLKHRNPDGTVINGSHWHIYKQGYGREYAVPAENVTSSDFEANTMRFFREFNIVKPPKVAFQQELSIE